LIERALSDQSSSRRGRSRSNETDVGASCVRQHGWSEPLTMAASNRLSIICIDARRLAVPDCAARVPMGRDAYWVR
jgi:hypothetical protein